MNLFKKESNFKAHNHFGKLFRSTLLLLSVSSLVACGQAETNALNESTSKLNTESTSVVQANVPAPVMASSIANPDLLKNVSATVYKDANCGCCKEWVSHAEDNGLNATAHDVADMSLFKDRYGVPDNMRSCHTTVTTDGYVFEGHVPAKYVAEFLANPPMQALGLAVPGMPMGSPGMEYQNKFDPYQIMQLNKDGSSEVYADIESVEQQL